MAAKKKKVRKKAGKKRRQPTNAHAYAEFIGDVLDGTIAPVQLYESFDAEGHVALEYDEEADDV